MNKRKLLQRLTRLGLPASEYWLVAGAAMVLYGLREETADLDLGCTKELADELERRGCPVTRLEDGTRRFRLAPDAEIFEDWLFDKVESIQHVPVISLRGLIEMKRRLGRQKDFDDISRIPRLLRLASPIGPLRLVAGSSGLTHLLLEGQSAPAAAEEDTPLLRQAAEELDEYFSGRRKSFTVPLHPSGTQFQQTVWAALRTIPYGETVSYQELARQIGKPSAARAVGGANGKNPLPILIPCHRVIAADGSLGGYSLGLELKRRLLGLEVNHR